MRPSWSAALPVKAAEFLAEWATSVAYALVLLGMGVVVLAGGSLLLLLRFTWWAFCLPGRLLSENRKDA